MAWCRQKKGDDPLASPRKTPTGKQQNKVTAKNANKNIYRLKKPQLNTSKEENSTGSRTRETKQSNMHTVA